MSGHFESCTDAITLDFSSLENGQSDSIATNRQARENIAGYWQRLKIAGIFSRSRVMQRTPVNSGGFAVHAGVLSSQSG